MNETFSFKRFGTYFKYDITRLWRKHSRTVLLVGLSGVIAYVVCVLFSLIFNHSYQAPGIVGRAAVFCLAMLVLELYQTRFYGYLTDKKEGSEWIMIPASKVEKFVSMLLNTIIIIPLAFLLTFFFTDWFICLVDPTAGEALISKLPFIWDFFQSVPVEDRIEMSQIGLNPALFLIMTILTGWGNYLYFLLCGICFKKNKIFYAILILFGASTILSIVSAVSIPFINFDALDNMDEEKIKAFFKGMITVSYVLGTIYTVAMGWGVWRRISTIKH